MTNFLATYHTSPLTVTIVGCIKQITTIVISVFLFNKPLSKLNIIGIVVTTIGSTWYSLLGLKKKPQEQQKLSTDNQKDEELKEDTIFEKIEDDKELQDNTKALN